MRITILCTSHTHPVNARIETWMAWRSKDHQVDLVRTRKELTQGEVLFLISCGEIITKKDRDQYGHTFVLHASDLPKGRGWNPHIWAVVNGANEITVTLLEAEDKVDTGAIWGQLVVPIPKHLLWNELNEALFDAEFKLMDMLVDSLGSIQPRAQAEDVEPTYYRLRRPSDSELDPQRSIAEQFDLLRVCDPDRYPAYIQLNGHRYTVKVEKVPSIDA